MNWTNEDIDAAYLLGVIRGAASLSKSDSVTDALLRDIELLKEQGHASPSELVKKIRHENLR